MRILYASAIETHAEWGAETFLNPALVSAGIDTIPVDFRRNRWKLASIWADSPPFDLFFLQRGDDFPLSLVHAVRKPRVFYFSELFARQRDADHLFRSDAFDHYLVRGPTCREQLTERGWVSSKKSSTHLSAFDPLTFFPLDTNRDIDVLFLGSPTPRRMEILRFLSSHVNVRCVQAFGREANTYFNRSKIVLNLHAEDFIDTETRVFEVLGSGALLVSEKMSRENPFVPGEHFVEASDVSDIVRQLKHYLAHSERNDAIRRAGCREAATHHTYSNRASELARLFARLVAEANSEDPSIDKQIVSAYARREALHRLKPRMPSQAQKIRRKIAAKVGR